MFKNELNKILGFVLAANPYFDTGFAECWYDEETGYVWAKNSKDDRLPIFPEGQFGNYFYLRIDTKIRLEQERRWQNMEGARGITPRGSVTLIAIVNDADNWLLLQNLINTLGKYETGYISLNAAESNREIVTLNEMKYADEETQMKALQNLRKETIVSIDFTLNSELFYQQLNCLPNPIKP